MGCNGWNHASDCQCGWGGDTSAYRTYSSEVWRIAPPDGLEWCFDRKPSFDTYTNPNARCPVCGEAVFFYQSPYGGRVFFDELGPPWPKHPCTDNSLSQRRDVPILPPVSSRARPVAVGRYPLDWQPLIPFKIEKNGEIDCITIDPKTTKIAGKQLFVATGLVGNAPTYWRRSAENPGDIDLLTIRVSEKNAVEESLLTVAACFNSMEEFYAQNISSQICNRIGWSLSFEYRTENKKWIDQPGVDFSNAKLFFEKASKSGCWEALNNLAVMARDGLGGKPDSQDAIDKFKRAAASLDPIPLSHLARCFREGLGTSADSEKAEWLESLAKRMHAKAKSQQKK